MRKPRRRDSGFTLVELLVSLALLGMMASLLLATISTGRGVERRAALAALAGESVAAAQTLIRARVETMVAEPLPGAPFITDVRGDTGRFSFTAGAPGLRQPAPPQRYRLMLTNAGELSLFSIDPLSTRANPLAPEVFGWERAPLLGNVARLDIDYFGAAPPDNQRRWRAIWQDRPDLPELVRVRVAFRAGDTRFWPVLIAHPAAHAKPPCRPGPGGCAGSA